MMQRVKIKKKKKNAGVGEWGAEAQGVVQPGVCSQGCAAEGSVFSKSWVQS